MNRVYQKRKERRLERQNHGWHGLGSFPNKAYYEQLSRVKQPNEYER